MQESWLLHAFLFYNNIKLSKIRMGSIDLRAEPSETHKDDYKAGLLSPEEHFKD